MKTDKERIDEAVEIGMMYGQIDGSHHKTWVIDQMLRILLGDSYNETVRSYLGEEVDGEYEYSWDEGIAP